MSGFFKWLPLVKRFRKKSKFLLLKFEISKKFLPSFYKLDESEYLHDCILRIYDARVCSSIEVSFLFSYSLTLFGYFWSIPFCNIIC